MPFDSVDEHRETTTRECVTRGRQSRLDDWDNSDHSKRKGWLANEKHSRPGNPYRRKKPKSKDIIAAEVFHLTGEDGQFNRITFSNKFILCREYLWINQTLSIPLSSIIDTGQLDRCGYIRFWDSIARAEIELCFNSPQFFRARRKAIDAFLAVVNDHLPEEEPVPKEGPATDPNESLDCEKCGSAEAQVLVFHAFSFFGVFPCAWRWELTPVRYVLCAEHARSQAIRCSLRTALHGYLGVPGCFIAPWYVLKNLLELRREGTCDSRTVILSLLGCVVLPYALMATAFLLLDGWLGSNGTVQG